MNGLYLSRPLLLPHYLLLPSLPQHPLLKPLQRGHRFPQSLNHSPLHLPLFLTRHLHPLHKTFSFLKSYCLQRLLNIITKKKLWQEKKRDNRFLFLPYLKMKVIAVCITAVADPSYHLPLFHIIPFFNDIFRIMRIHSRKITIVFNNYHLAVIIEASSGKQYYTACCCLYRCAFGNTYIHDIVFLAIPAAIMRGYLTACRPYKLNLPSINRCRNRYLSYMRICWPVYLNIQYLLSIRNEN